MADQPPHSDQAGIARAQSDPQPPAGSPIYSGLQQCPNCGAVTGRGDTVCQECGEDLERRPRQIRCRYCQETGSSALVLCPHCGRELQAAPPRLLTWGVPALLALLFLLLLANRWESNSPVAWLQSQSTQLSGIIALVDEGMEPTGDSVMIATGNETLTNNGGAESIVALAPTATPDQPAADTPATLLQATEAAEPTLRPTVEPTIEPTATALPTLEPTEEPTAQPTATSTTAPTNTPAATSTSTAAPTQRATRQATATAAATSSGATLSLPTATATPNAATIEARAATEAADAGGTGGSVVTTYTVRSGDTLLGIAAQFEIPVQAIMAANSIAANEVYSIRPGEELIIPLPGTSADAPTATPAPPTATTQPRPDPTATPTTTPTVIALRLDAPNLRSPESGTTVSCTGSGQLTWSQVEFIQPTDRYVLHLGFVSGRGEGGEDSITWVLQQPVPSSRAAWEMDSDLCALAPQELGRRWQWYVEVIDAASESVSPASDIWEFTWN